MENMEPPPVPPSKHPEGFDGIEPTAQMLGRFQPWHEGHTALFERILETEAKQVCILIRHMPIDDNNPLQPHEVGKYIEDTLKVKGYTQFKDYVIMIVPNIINISYGRDVGYTFTKHDLGEEIHSISATKIRAENEKNIQNE